MPKLVRLLPIREAASFALKASLCKCGAMLAPSLKYALHPHLPERLGFRALLRLVNPDAAKLLDQTDAYTLVQARSRVTMIREAERILERGVTGTFVEFGVHRGGSAAVLADAIKGTGRHLHLFDKWDDRPPPTDEDGFRKEQYAEMTPERRAKIEGAFEATRAVVEQVVGFPRDRVRYHAGWFDDTIAAYDGGPIAFASIDCDIYNSMLPVLDLCERQASPGAVFVIDDYGSWPGVAKALHEWLASTKRRAQLIRMGRVKQAIVRLND